MDIDQLNELSQQAVQKMDAGDFKGALNLAYKIRSLGPHYVVSYTVSALLIDIGAALENEEMVKEGVELLQKDFEAIVRHEKYALDAYYNLAKGYSDLFNFKMMRDPYVGCFKEQNWTKQRFTIERYLAMTCKMQCLHHELG